MLNLSINLNETVYVRLTQAGREQLLNYWRKSHIEVGAAERAADCCHPGWNTEAWVRFQLHSLMNIFGPDLWLGCEVPFVSNEIRLPLGGSV